MASFTILYAIVGIVMISTHHLRFLEICSELDFFISWLKISSLLPTVEELCNTRLSIKLRKFLRVGICIFSSHFGL